MVKKCPYCETDGNDFNLLNQYADYSGIEIAINRQGMLRARCYDDDKSTFISQDIVNIKYCPMCGKDLEVM